MRTPILLRTYASTTIPSRHAVALVNMGGVDESLPLFRKVFTADKNWLTLTPRLVNAGLLPKDQAVIERILTATN